MAEKRGIFEVEPEEAKQEDDQVQAFHKFRDALNRLAKTADGCTVLSAMCKYCGGLDISAVFAQHPVEKTYFNEGVKSVYLNLIRKNITDRKLLFKIEEGSR